MKQIFRNMYCARIFLDGTWYTRVIAVFCLFLFSTFWGMGMIASADRGGFLGKAVPKGLKHVLLSTKGVITFSNIMDDAWKESTKMWTDQSGKG